MLREVAGELRTVSGRGGLVDGVLPPLLFVTVNAFAGLQPAAYAGIGLAVLIVLWRLVRKNSARYAFSGLVGTAIAIGLALRSGDARNYFLPGIITGALTSVLIVATIAARRPFVAWTSWATRQWPLEWYWHPRVRPAYTATSWLWFGFFAIRTGAQAWLYATERTTTLGVVRAVTGWPGLLALLVATYALGRKMLVSLEGPSVEEFETGKPPPWSSQQHGF